MPRPPGPLAAEGFRVSAPPAARDRIEALAAEIGGEAVACDVTSRSPSPGLGDAVGDSLHVLVNNAGGAFGSEPVDDGRPATTGARCTRST